MFGGRFYLFTILGFPVYANSGWLIIAMLLTWSLSQSRFPAMAPGYNETVYLVMGVLGSIGLFGSILLHEIGHMLEARRCKIPTGDITLHLFGGLAQIYAAPRKPSVEATVALAGPAVTVLLAIASFGASFGLRAANAGEALVVIFDYLWFINALLLVFNLMPAYPLDGGRVLHAVLWAVSGKELWARRAAATVGLVFASVLIAEGVLSLLGIPTLLFGGFWSILIGAYLFMAANAARKGYPV